MTSWRKETDIVVVGFGAAGAVAAIAAHDAGADVIIIEKMPDPGGLSLISAGGIRIAFDRDQALRYLDATCGERTPTDHLAILASGMTGIPGYLSDLARAVGATDAVTAALGNYPFEGYRSLGYSHITHAPSLRGATSYHAARSIGGGARLFSVLEDNVRNRRIPVFAATPAKELLTSGRGQVRGVVVSHAGSTRTILARKAVVLTCGGFEANEDMKRQYFQAAPVLAGSFLGNTGDGIAMSQKVGADLWHMWHYHGPYGLRHPDPDCPLGLYVKQMPMWTPEPEGAAVDTMFSPTARAVPRMAWILVDRYGRRFMDEYPPYASDTGCRPFDTYDPANQCFPRIPAFMIFDEAGRRMYPLGRSVTNDRKWHYDWSADNLKEVANGIFASAWTIVDLARVAGIEPDRLSSTIASWNEQVARGCDDQFGRRPETMTPIIEPPFYCGAVYPMVINTQGGPRHDVWQRVVDPFGSPIDRLYAAGELGSVFGHLYMAGGNLAECFVGGRIAGSHAASLPNWAD
jgi:succinate dehydrogenase/fumarate reductase flavoprotein subunit